MSKDVKYKLFADIRYCLHLIFDSDKKKTLIILTIFTDTFEDKILFSHYSFFAREGQDGDHG